MKLKLYAALLAVLPVAAIAQPTVTDREQYGNNSIVHYLYTNQANIGSTGANQTWNFPALSGFSGTSDDTLTEHIIVPGSSTGPYAGLVQAEIFSDSTVRYMKMNGSNLGISFFADSTSPASSITYSHPLIDQIFTMTYGATASDRDTVTISNAGMPGSGTGNVTLTVDASGTLILPNGSYSNVVRLKEVTDDTLTVSTFTIFNHEVLYRWYDAMHASPLLAIDSAIFTLSFMGNMESDTSTYTRYLLNEHISTGVSNVPFNHVSFNGYIGNKDVILSGSFAAGSKYTTIIFNMAGQKVYENNFTGGQGKVAMPLSNSLATGTYTILVMEAGKPETMNTVKAIKE